MRRVLWATLVLLAVANALDAELVAWSREACADDPPCAARFGLQAGDASAYEQRRFAEMLAVFVQRREDGGIGAADLVAECLAAPTPGCPGVQWMWIGMLRQAHVCGDNEEWIVDHGCECIDGKHCNTDCAQQQTADVWSLNVLVAIFGLGTLVFFVSTSRTAGTMRRAIDDRVRDAAINFYTAQAELFLVTAPVARFGTAPLAAQLTL